MTSLKNIWEAHVTSGQKTPQSGLYRTECCGQEIVLTVDEPIPACKDCGQDTDWQLIRSNGEHEEAA
jgi:hypothetical protein